MDAPRKLLLVFFHQRDAQKVISREQRTVRQSLVHIRQPFYHDWRGEHGDFLDPQRLEDVDPHVVVESHTGDSLQGDPSPVDPDLWPCRRRRNSQLVDVLEDVFGGRLFTTYAVSPSLTRLEDERLDKVLQQAAELVHPGRIRVVPEGGVEEGVREPSGVGKQHSQRDGFVLILQGAVRPQDLEGF